MKNKFTLSAKDTYLIFDLHGVLTSKIEMGKQYDDFVANFLVDQFHFNKEETIKAIKKANNSWLRFWKKAKKIPQSDFIVEYEKANALWAKIILQGKVIHDYRQLAEFLEYFVPANLCCIYPEVKTVLEELHKMGAHLILASSANTRHSTGVLFGCKIFHLFDTIIGLENTKTLKSNIAYYEKILEMINQTAEKCVFIGNSIFEIDLPKKLGMKTIHIAREIEKSIVASENNADVILPDLTDLILTLFS